MEFADFVIDLGFKDSWISNYSMYIMEDTKKIIHLDCNIKEFYILYSIFHCFKYNNSKVIFVSSDQNEITYYFSKILDKAKLASDLYNINKNLIKFFNGSFIEIIPLTVITNNTLKSDLLLIDINSFNTKIGEYIIYNVLLNEKNNLDVLCSVKDINSSFFFSDLVINCINYRIPVIAKNF